MPYPDHPKGCPNYGKRKECPPTAPLVQDYIDLEQPHWFIIQKYDLNAHVQRMKVKHPHWSDRQARCVLYWQGAVKGMLSKACKQFIKEHPGLISTLIPEAMGVNVIATAIRMGIPIKARPDGTIYKIALVGHPPIQPQKSLLEFGGRNDVEG